MFTFCTQHNFTPVFFSVYWDVVLKAHRHFSILDHFFGVFKTFLEMELHLWVYFYKWHKKDYFGNNVVLNEHKQTQIITSKNRSTASTFWVPFVQRLPEPVPPHKNTPLSGWRISFCCLWDQSFKFWSLCSGF